MEQQITEAQLEKLQHRASRVRSSLNRRAEKPLVVEFAGSPKAGKSSTIDTVVHFFKRTDFRVFAPTEGASKRTPEQLRQDKVAFNVWTINDAISQLLAAYHEGQSDLIILDRGCFDSIAWCDLHVKQGKLSPEEAKVIKDFAIHPHWIGYISRLYLFTCAPGVSMQRETAATLTSLEGSTMNSNTLAALLQEYDGLVQTLSDEYEVRKLDTTSPGSPRASGYFIADDILKIWESNLPGELN
ncbi:ATP-binding protein [Streptomyces sp. NBC_00461]|uniref:hypothetical protein n=1 Tax=Streptomyces sp. NBC_00461 TaxID=2975750 RepID=UPI002E188313